MIYLKRIFFIISCVIFSFLIWNFWNTHASINQNNVKINSFVHKVYDINNNSNIQLINVPNGLIFLDIGFLKDLVASLNTLKNSDFLNTKYSSIDFKIIKNFFYKITSKSLNKNNFNIIKNIKLLHSIKNFTLYIFLFNFQKIKMLI